MGSGYDASKKDSSTKTQKTDPNKTTIRAAESAEHLSTESESNTLLPSTLQASTSFGAQEFLGNQQVRNRQLESMTATFADQTVEDEAGYAKAQDQRQTSASGNAPSLENEEFWSQLFGGDPAPAEPRDGNTHIAEHRKIPWLGGWTMTSKGSYDNETMDSAVLDNDTSYRKSALNRWSPDTLFESKEHFTLESTINLKWYHPIKQSITASRFIAAHSSNPVCQRLSTITGPFPSLTSTSSLLIEIGTPECRTLAAQTAISLSLASSSIEIACSNHKSPHPDTAVSIILCAPLVKHSKAARTGVLRNSDAQSMFNKEIEELCDLFPKLSKQTAFIPTEPRELDFNGDVEILTAALNEVVGVIHIPEINDPFKTIETKNKGAEVSGAVAELDAILAGPTSKDKQQYEIGLLVNETLNFIKTVSSIRFAYTKLATAVWIACGHETYDALYASLKSAMPPIKVIARGAQVHLHLIELNLKDDIDTAKIHFSALSRLSGELRLAIAEQIQNLAEIAAAYPSRSHETVGDDKKDTTLIRAIASIETGNMEEALHNIERQTLETEAPKEQDLLLSTLRLAILFGSSDKSTTHMASQATAEMAKLKNAPFHNHFAKIIRQLIRQGKESSST